MAAHNILGHLDPLEMAKTVAGTWLPDVPTDVSWQKIAKGYPPRQAGVGDFVIGPTSEGVYDPIDHLSQYAAAGCTALMLDKVPDGLEAGLPVLKVKRIRLALFQLASRARSKVAGKVMAITGSSGKTTMKDMLAFVLSAQGATVASPGTVNSLMAICYQMINAPLNADHYVFESGLGATGSGIALHSSLLKPHVAVITTVHPAHAEGYSTVADIVRSKMDICKHLQPDGYLLIDRDTEHYALMMGLAVENGTRQVMTFGEHPDSDVRIDRMAIDEHGTSAVVSIGGIGRTVKLGMYGEHWMKLAAAVLGCCHVMWLDLDQVVRDLQNFQTLSGRGRIYPLPFGDGKLLIFDSHFNANPGSMRADLNAFAAVSAQRKQRCIAVVGEMRELGKLNAEAHRELARHLNTLNFSRIFLVGEATRVMPDLLQAPTSCFFEPDALLPGTIASQLQAGDFVFIKGSHSNRLDLVIKRLEKATKELSEKVYSLQ